VLVAKPLELLDYLPCLEAMRRFTASRSDDTSDEIWLVEHPSVFTLGLAGKPEHLLNPGNIPVIQTERGGQVTYHGPGQLIAYTLLNLRRLNLTVKGLVCLLEKSAIGYFDSLQIPTTIKTNAPGVYIKLPGGEPGAKIAALGLKVSRGCSFHGIALNIDMDLEPFNRINPCGYAGLDITSVAKELRARSTTSNKNPPQIPTLHQASEDFTKVLLAEIESLK
jgi:lipoyl(octanoyl) transferase